MTIAFVSDAIYPYNKGGKEKRFYELSTRLAKMGHDVHIYTMHWWESPEKTRIENGVMLHAICKLHPLYVKGQGDRRSMKEAILFSLACLKLTRATFDVIEVDHMPYFPIFTTWIVCKLKRRKLNATWNEALKRSEWVDYMGWKGNIAAVIERISIRLPDRITVISSHTIELIKSELKRDKDLCLVPPGIDSAFIKKVEPINMTIDILFIGRLVKDKRVGALLRAIAILKKQNSSIECVIIGSGLEEKNLHRLIKKLGLTANVHLIGNLKDDTSVYSYMKAAKVFALPSRREGFGMVALEALACGTPVVTIDSPANAARLLVKNGVTGSVVNGSSASLAAAIEEWIEKAPSPKVITRETAEYDWKSLASKQAEVYAA